jgi:hypothetical protein
MPKPRAHRPRRRSRAEVAAEPEEVVAEMEQATQRLRDQAWKINAVTRTPLIAEETVRARTNAAE